MFGIGDRQSHLIKPSATIAITSRDNLFGGDRLVDSEKYSQLVSFTVCKILLYKDSAIQNPALLTKASNTGFTSVNKPRLFASIKIPRSPVNRRLNLLATHRP